VAYVVILGIAVPGRADKDMPDLERLRALRDQLS
jgi:hypothetical protein